MRLSIKEITRYLDVTYDLNQNKAFYSVWFNIWGFLVKVETSALYSKNVIETQFENFIEPQPYSKPDIVIRIIRVNSFLIFPEMTDYNEYSRENRRLVVGPFYVCRFNESLDYFEVIVKGSDDLFLLSVMRVIAPHLATKLDGSLFHASGLSYNNKLYTFIGESGVGKSTVIKMLSDYQVLSDEAIMIRSDNTDGLLGWGTPYGREHGGTNICVPLGYCFFLVQDTATYLEKLSPTQAVTRLVSNLWCINTVGNLALRAFDLSMQISQQIPCYLLHFELNDSFWKEINRLVSFR